MQPAPDTFDRAASPRRAATADDVDMILGQDRAGTIAGLDDGRLEDDASRHQDAYLAALHDTGLGLLSRMDLDTVLRDIVVRACDLLGTPQGYLSLVGPDDSMLRAAVMVGVSPDHISRPYGRGQGVAGTIWQTAVPLVVNDYGAWPGRLHGGERERARAVVGVPLITDGAVRGVLSCVHTDPDKRFDRRDVELLARFGQLAAIALDNARAHRALRDELDARVIAERGVRESEERYRRLVEQSPEAILIHCEGRYVYANPAAVHLLGGEHADDIVGRAVLDFVEPEDRALVQERIRLTCEEHRPAAHMEVRRRRLDGAGRVTETFGIPTVHAGKPAAQVIYRDVTARKRAERRDVAFATVAQRLGAASSAEDAARAVADAADDLLGWDAFALYLYIPEEDALRPVLSFDEVGGRRMAVAAPIAVTRPSRLIRRVFAAGGQLILRDGPPAPREGLTPFGDTARLSASLMFVPVRRGPRAIGFLTIQSYAVNAYAAADVATLQVLADQCAGALERTRAEDALRAGERRFRALIEKSADAIALVDAEGIVSYAGPSTEQALGYRPEEIVGTSIVAFIHPEDRPHAAAAMGAILDRPGASASAHYRIRRKDGSWLWLEGTVTNRLDDPELGAILGNYRDITDRKRSKEEARRSQQSLSAAIDALSAHIAVLDETGTIVAVNAAWRRFAAENGYADPHDGVGMNYLDTCGRAHAGDRTALRFRAGLHAVLTDARDRYELEYPCHSPVEERWFRARVTRFPGDGPTRVVVAHEDISEQKRAERALHHRAMHDALTDLPNRAYLRRELERAIAEGQRDGTTLAVLFLDLDRFKQVNDSLGHIYGDALLVSVADRLRASLPAGAILARLGGDEFTVLLERITGPGDAEGLADRLRRAVGRPFTVRGHALHVTMSIGIALSDRGHAAPEDLLRDADIAMYRAKQGGSAVRGIRCRDARSRPRRARERPAPGD